MHYAYENPPHSLQLLIDTFVVIATTTQWNPLQKDQPSERTAQYNRAFSRDVTRTKLIKNGRHFGVQHRFLEKLACLSMEPRSYIEALGAELVGKEDEWTN